MNIYTFFYHSLPPEGELTLEELHFVVRDVWLARLDSELEAERAARRKGRPKSTKEQKLEEQKLREAEVYRTGMGECMRPPAPLAARLIQVSEVIDLTHPPTLSCSANGTRRRRRMFSSSALSGYRAPRPGPSCSRGRDGIPC